MKNSFRFILCAGATLLLLWPATPVHAGDTVTLNNPPFLPGESAAQCYADAVDNLNHGTWFERAIVQLKEAIRQEPKNEDYHLALGCAYTDRAASIAYAAGYAEFYKGDGDQYKQSLASWTKDQSDPTSDDYQKPPPVPPPAFNSYTKDDWKWFTLTPEQTKARLVDLAGEAKSEFAQAVALSKSPADQAKAEYEEGWALDMLAMDSIVFVDYYFATQVDNAQQPIAGMPKPQDVLATFARATTDDPGNAIYWESLGDVLDPHAQLIPSSESSISIPPVPALKGMTSDQAFRKALALDPKNALLWWYIAQFEVGSDPAKAVPDLKQAIAAEQNNAFPMYILAEAELEQTNYINNHLEDANVVQKDFAATEKVDRDMAATLTDQDRKLASDAIFWVEQGNEAAFCSYPIYRPLVPRALSVAFGWMYRTRILFPALSKQRALARDLCGYADVCALQGDLTAAFNVDQDIVAMGKRMVGDWSMQEDWSKGQTLISELVGVAIASIGYKDMVRIAQNYGDQDMAQAVQAESDAFTDQETQWKHGLQQTDAIDQDMYDNY